MKSERANNMNKGTENQCDKFFACKPTRAGENHGPEASAINIIMVSIDYLGARVAAEHMPS